MNQRIKTEFRTTPKQKDKHKEMLLFRFDRSIADLTCISVLTHPGFWPKDQLKEWEVIRNSIIDLLAALIDLKTCYDKVITSHSESE